MLQVLHGAGNGRIIGRCRFDSEVGGKSGRGEGRGLKAESKAESGKPTEGNEANEGKGSNRGWTLIHADRSHGWAVHRASADI